MKLAAGAILVFTAACSNGSAPGSTTAGCAPPRSFADEAADLVVAPLGEPVWVMATAEATFSSPRVVDLNGDDVLDVVQGFGQDTFGARESSVIATDGATGALLWKSTGHEDLVGSATFAHLGGDDAVDVIIGGSPRGRFSLLMERQGRCCGHSMIRAADGSISIRRRSWLIKMATASSMLLLLTVGS